MSPEVWVSAKAIITTAISDIGGGDSPATIATEWPNEDFETPAPPLAWLSIEVGADAAETIELGNLMWRESGAIWLHLMLPLGIGIDDGLKWRKALSVAFRSATPDVVGLFWRDHSFDPLSADDGVWRRLSLIIRYTFDDILT